MSLLYTNNLKKIETLLFCIIIYRNFLAEIAICFKFITQNWTKNKGNNFPIIIAQHMPQSSTRNFINNLRLETKHQITEGRHNLIIEAGHIIVCRGGIDTQVHWENNKLVLKEVDFSDHLLHPSVNVLFKSAARLSKYVVWIILTGLGNDGRKGSRKLEKTNNLVVTQAPETCLAESMPNAVIEKEAVSYIFKLSQISRLFSS